MRAFAPLFTRRALLRDMAALALGTVCPVSFAQHGGPGLVTPPVRLDDTWLVDQTGRKRLLNDLLRQGVTALQTVYTGCGTVCPMQGVLFGTVQDQLPAIRARHSVHLLSVGIDPLSDSPSALRAWLARYRAGPAWNAATPALSDVDRMRMALSGSKTPLGNIADHSTQVYCFDANAMLRWRSADLPRVNDLCDVLGALARA
ncbi:SCO family protein (plasmid) [Burkholderia sp. SFA1]|uniref:SCO family protein n=1 Tax=unclassified Caballeronia TaxID=2646786 RepID=UPI001F38557D|nr:MULTISPECIES: SCO family protein [unclassified Caballeronia]MCE4545803.1 SCO family protein [Caballeronia sp. PC1]MCE4572075.1 SCO family protein [Caballeronia sp. CLC5]BBQ01154.1 SCO family protein [Burkholderia sp. SFA1]